MRRIQTFAADITALIDVPDVDSLEEAMALASAEGVLLGVRGRVNQQREIERRRKRRHNRRMGR